MDLYEQLKLLIESPNASAAQKEAAGRLYRMLLPDRDMDTLATPPSPPAAT